MGGGWPRTCPFLRLGKLVVALRAGPLASAFLRLRDCDSCKSMCMMLNDLPNHYGITDF